MSRPKSSPDYLRLVGRANDITRDRSSANVPSSAVAGRPVMSPFLGKDGQKEWRRLVRQLSDEGKICKLDHSILELHCTTYQRYRDCLREIESHGPFETDEYGARVESAASKLATKLAGVLKQTIVALGISPTHREKVKPTKPPKEAIVPGSIADLMQREKAGEFDEPEPEPEPKPETNDQINTEAVNDEPESEY